MIKEAYCSFEVSKLLKEKGFDGEIRTTFDKEGYTQPSITHQMAMKWLREIHGIDISIKITNLVDKNRKYYGMIWDRDNNTYIVDLFDTYEETEEAVLKTCLENLI